MTSYKSQKSFWILIVLVIVGGLAGSALTEMIAPYFPYIRSTANIGFDPFVLGLHFMSLTVGFKMSFSPLTALGLIVGYWAYRRI